MNSAMAEGNADFCRVTCDPEELLIGTPADEENITVDRVSPTGTWDIRSNYSLSAIGWLNGGMNG